MAEPVTPRLPTTAEANPYAPYSFLAVLSLIVAVFFAVVLIVLGISAWLAGQPLFEQKLLLVPLVALVLAFAARRQIQNSEGTRVGLHLCKYAWWIAVVGGFGYGAYLLGIGFAIRSDAEDAFRRWEASLIKANPHDPKNTDLAAAFHAIIPPEKQPTISPNELSKSLGVVFAPQMVAFKQSDLMRVVSRNAGETRFDVVGLEDWENDRAGGLRCRLTVTLHCPEGEFTMSLPMQRQTVAGRGEPVWQIVPPTNEGALFFKSAKLTRYGERIRDLELSAQKVVYASFLGAFHERSALPTLFDEFDQPQPDPRALLERLRSRFELRGALLGGSGWTPAHPKDGYEALAARRFQPLERGDPVQEQKQRQQFARCWRAGVIVAPGQILAKNPDQGTIIVPGEKAWEVRVPVEMQESIAERSPSAARAAVVCVLDDPATLKELLDLRKEPGPAQAAIPRIEVQRPIPWRISRIESDMKVHTPPRAGPGPGE